MRSKDSKKFNDLFFEIQMIVIEIVIMASTIKFRGPQVGKLFAEALELFVDGPILLRLPSFSENRTR